MVIMFERLRDSRGLAKEYEQLCLADRGVVVRSDDRVALVAGELKKMRDAEKKGHREGGETAPRIATYAAEDMADALADVREEHGVEPELILDALIHLQTSLEEI